MIRYDQGLENWTFKEVKQQCPTAQQRVYLALLSLTPAQLVFELPRGRKFCHERIDADTYVIIGKVMAAIMEEHNLILTQDDVLLCFLRFRELIFLYEATRQGVMLTKVTENSIDYYYVDGDEKPEDAEPETAVKYVKRMKHYHGGII